MGVLMNTNDFTTLELSVETIRELNEDELARVHGGSDTDKYIGPPTGTIRCPSGDTWTARCEI